MRLFSRILAALVLCVWTAVALAQSAAETTPDYGAWEELAAVAERTVDTRSADNDRLEVLRESLTEYRAQFAESRSLNAPRIASLKDQIEALGPEPETGTEPREVAERRDQLNAQLQSLQAPVQVAEEAFLRADGLVGEIDAIIRERQARRLLSLGPSPLNPVHWPNAVMDVGKILLDLLEDTKDVSDPDVREGLSGTAPLILLMTAAGVLFIVRGRRWAGLALSYLRRWGGRGTGVWRFLVSLFRIILPLTGVLLLTNAARATGLTGDRIAQVLEAIPLWGAFLFGFRWLAERLFSRDADDALIRLSDEARRQARFYMLIVSFMLVTRGAIELLLSFEAVDAATEAVLAFPAVVVMGLALAGIGALLRNYRVEGDEDGDEPTRGAGLARVLRFAGNGMIAVAVVSPGMAAVGYAEAGNAILYPTIISLSLMALVLALQRFFADVYILITRQGGEGRDALIPALAGFVLVLLSLPFHALIWGARVADLTELWAIFNRGFAIGDTRISPSDFITFAVIFGLGFALTRLLQSTLRINVLPKTRIDIGGQNALVSGLGYVGIFLSAVLAITGAGIDLSSFAIVAGALSVGIGFGLRTIVENFVSGIILLIGRPISEGDWIEVGGRMGYVRDISVRSTRIETFDRTDVIVPNADLVTGTVTNYTRGSTVGRLTVSVGVAYGTDTRKVDKILHEIALDQPLVLAKPEPSVIFANFGADALEFEIRMFLRDVNWIMNVKSDVNHAIAERFAEEGIEVPFAQRDIWLRNPEALRAEAAPARQAVEENEVPGPSDKKDPDA